MKLLFAVSIIPSWFVPFLFESQYVTGSDKQNFLPLWGDNHNPES